LTADFPSPGMTGTIAGHVHFKGIRPKRGFWISANGTGDKPGNGMAYFPADATMFKIGPMSVGRYNLQLQSPQLEMKPIPAVATGTNDLVLEITVRAPLLLKGRIDAGKPGAPLANVRVRVSKTQSLHGR